MTQPSLQRTAFWGVLWTALQSFCVQIIGFAVGVQLARILSPDDYGLVGMLSIFTALAGSFVDCGMGKALVQKQDCSDADYNTVFYYSAVISIIAYVALYFSAPLIASFYSRPELILLTRFISIPLLLSPFNSLLGTMLYKELKMKKMSQVSIASALVGGITGVLSAYMGCGVWSLVYMQLASATSRVVFNWVACPWFPSWTFSIESFKKLFGFGSKLLATGIIGSIFDNLKPLLVGKYYDASSLGYYTRAQHYADMPAQTATGILTNIAFPLLCRFQDNNELLQVKYRLMIRLNAFVIFPLVVGLASVAEPCIVVLITDKWLPCALLLQILCFALMWYPVHALNLSLLLVTGQTTRYLHLEIVRKSILLIILIITVPISVAAMCYGAVISSLLCLGVNTYYTGKLIQVGFFRQMGDLLPIFLLSLAMGAGVWCLVTFLPLSPVLQLAVGIPAGAFIYVGSAALFRMPELTEAWQLIRNNLRKS